MNLVIDTNIWISALISKNGASREVIRLALLGDIFPQISSALFLEYEAVMKRESIKKRCILDEKEQQELFEAFLSCSAYNEIFYLWRPNLNDADDNFLVELAVASNSDYIITENNFSELHFDFKVLTAKDFLNRRKI